MKTLVVGLGNPILGDDGVGWKVAEEVEQRMRNSDLGTNNDSASPLRFASGAIVRTPHSAIDVDCLSLGGLSLMERLIDYRRVILIDAIGTGHRPIGSVYHFLLDETTDPSAGHTTAAHDVSLMTAIKMGRSLGAELPDQISVVAIESPYVYDFSEELTPPVAAAVPQAVEMVLELLEKGISS